MMEVMKAMQASITAVADRSIYVTTQVQRKVFPLQQSGADGTELQANEERSNQPISGEEVKASVANSQPAEATRRAVVERTAGKCQKMNMKMGDEEVEAVIDTGSKFSTVTESW